MPPLKGVFMKLGGSSRGVLVSLVWAWMFVGSILSLLVISYVEARVFSMTTALNILALKPYLSVYVEIIAVGILPVVISIFCGDKAYIYGLSRKNLVKSLMLSLLFTVAILSIRVASGSGFKIKVAGFGLERMLGLLYAVLGIIAYGPLETFFVAWLLVNTEIALREYRRGRKLILTKSLFITTIAYGLAHIILSPKGGIVNAISVAVTFTVLMGIFKYTENLVGPMVAWTAINGYIPYLVLGCLK